MLTRTLLPLLLLLAPTALAECHVRDVDVNLPAYSAARDAHGTVRVHVQCDKPTDPYRVHVQTDNGMRAAGFGSAQLTLRGTDGRTLITELQEQGRTPGRGSTHITYTLLIPAGQWGATAGVYRAPLRAFLLSAPEALHP